LEDRTERKARKNEKERRTLRGWFKGSTVRGRGGGFGKGGVVSAGREHQIAFLKSFNSKALRATWQVKTRAYLI